MSKNRRINKNQQVTMTIKQIENLKKNATKEAVRVTNLLPLWVLRNQGWSTVRLTRFLEEYADLLDSYNRGYVTLEDIANQLYEETGVKIE